MIPRYTPKAFADLWSPLTRYQTWLEVELAACEAMESAQLVPSGTAGKIRACEIKLDPDQIEEIEKTTKHDVIAFLTHVEQLVGEDARWLHLGLTSSDVLDTSFALLLKRSAELIDERLNSVLKSLRVRIEEHRHTPMIGRSHGIHAEPITFGVCLAGHYAELVRCKSRLEQARTAIAFGTLSGAVGTFAHHSPSVEKQALTSLGLSAEPLPTQVVPRDRHAEFFSTLALIAGAVERFATQVRHWQRTEVLEAEEPFTKGQKGSSAMPHKRNPILSENLCGLARLMRAYAATALENTALWHERDISHSSAERIVAPDATTTLGFMLERLQKLIEGLVVYPDHMQRNLALTDGLWASESVLLSLVRKGIARQQAYVWVQRNAMRAFAKESSFRVLLGQDPDVSALLSPQQLDESFSLTHALRHADTLINRALGIPER